jgi:putative flippase GtrA
MKTGVQFVKFGLVGVLNSLVHYLVFLLLFRVAGIDMVASSALGYMAGVVNSFLLNRKWTFNITGSGAGSEFVKFCVVNLISMGVNLLVLQSFVSFAGILPEIAQMLAICCTLVINFAGNKWWTFRNGVRRTG